MEWGECLVNVSSPNATQIMGWNGVGVSTGKDTKRLSKSKDLLFIISNQVSKGVTYQVPVGLEVPGVREGH